MDLSTLFAGAETTSPSGLFELFVATTHDGILVSDLEGRLLYANARAEEISGYRADEFLGRVLWDLMVPDTIAEVRQRLDATGRGASVSPIFTGQIVRKDGTRRWVEVSSSAVVLEGRTVGRLGVVRDVDERRRVEDTMRLQAAALEAAANAIVITDAEGVIEWTNPAFTTLTGYEAADVVGRTPRLLKSGQHPPEFYRDLWDRLRSGQTWAGEMVNRHKDGSLYDELQTITPIRGRDGQIHHFVAIKQNITAQRRAEAARRELEATFFEFVENTRDVFWITDRAHSTVTYASPAYEDIWGRPRTALYAAPRAWVDAIHPDDRARVHDAMKAATAEGYDIEYRVVRPDGDVRFVHDRAFRLRPAGADIDSIVGIAEDVTDQVRARDEHARLATIVESSDDAIVSTTIDNRVVTWNAAAERLYGYTAAEMVGRPLHLLPPERSTHVDWTMSRIRRGEHIRNHDTVHLRKDGRRIDVAVTISPVTDAEGRVLGASLIARDISDRRRAEEHERQMQTRLARTEKLAAMGELLAGVAHEINNPLAVIIGQAELLADAEGRPGERGRKIAAAGGRCARIVRNFLTLARQQPPERRSVNLNTLVGETLEMIGYALHVEGVTAEPDLDPAVPALQADGTQLERALVNLVTNAIHAMRHTSAPRRLTITTRHRPETGSVRLEVRDTGPGIPPELESRLFEPFFTTKPVGEGTGLGLSMVKGIVEAHGGRVEVDARPGLGARFVIDLPLGGAGEPVDGPTAATAPLACQRVLVVDDEPMVGGLIVEMLAAAGHDAMAVTTGEEALARLREHPYDAILSDIKMPGLDGEMLYRALQHDRPEMAGRVAFITGDTLSATTQHFLEETGRPCLEKPFTAEALGGLLHQLVAPGTGARGECLEPADGGHR